MKRPFPNMLAMGISDIQSPYNYPMCMSVGEHVVKQSADVDRIKIYYNEFKSAIAYEIREIDLIFATFPTNWPFRIINNTESLLRTQMIG